MASPVRSPKPATKAAVSPEPSSPNKMEPFSTNLPTWVVDVIRQEAGIATPAALAREVLTNWAAQRRK